MCVFCLRAGRQSVFSRDTSIWHKVTLSLLYNPLLFPLLSSQLSIHPFNFSFSTNPPPLFSGPLDLSLLSSSILSSLLLLCPPWMNGSGVGIGGLDEWVMDERLAGWVEEGRQRGIGPQGAVQIGVPADGSLKRTWHRRTFRGKKNSFHLSVCSFSSTFYNHISQSSCLKRLYSIFSGVKSVYQPVNSVAKLFGMWVEIQETLWAILQNNQSIV